MRYAGTNGLLYDSVYSDFRYSVEKVDSQCGSHLVSDARSTRVVPNDRLVEKPSLRCNMACEEPRVVRAPWMHTRQYTGTGV
jgi:hypothetical protein